MNQKPSASSAGAHAGGGHGLERTRLQLGFIPLTDCAPLVVALERGHFRKYGLEVGLSREVSWANIRDKVAAGVLDGAQMLAPMPIATTLGLGEVRKPTITALSLDLNGNAITVTPALYRRMEQADPACAADRALLGRALARVIAEDRAAGRAPLQFAMVFPFSPHHYLLRYWLAAAGIDPDRDVRLQVVPPPYMVESLYSGEIDGCCVGEPWNAQAVALGVGHILLTDCELWNYKPEKVFGVNQEWAERHPNTHRALLMALLEAAEWLDQPGNRPEAAALLAREEYVNAPLEVVKQSLFGYFRVHPGGDLIAQPDFHVFHRHAATFPWRSHALWFLTQMYRWGQIDEALNLRRTAEQVYRPDLYREAAAALGWTCPAADCRQEEAEGWCDGRSFDPADPVAYLAGFELRRPRVDLDELARCNP